MTFAPDSMSLPLHVMCNSLLLASRLLDPNDIDSVLPRCNDKRFSTNHSLTDSNSLLRTSSISDTAVLSHQHIKEVYISQLLSYRWHISEIRGPSIVPCGTPHVTDLNLKKTPEISTACKLPLKYEINQFAAARLTPIALNLEVLWFTVSMLFVSLI